VQKLDFYMWFDPVVSSVELLCRLCCVVSYFVILLCLPSWVCPCEEAQIRLLRYLTQSRDGALNFELKIVEFL
jgi:hypothetical protein